MQNSVIVEHQESTDFALVLVATRSEYGRRSITPMIFVNDGCGIFAVAPLLKQWHKAGLVAIFDPPPDRREEILHNAVQEFVRQVALRSYIKECGKVGIVAKAKARSQAFDFPPPGFDTNREQEPALFWLCEKSENATQAVRILRYLIQKNGIGELSKAEREAIGERLLTRAVGSGAVRTKENLYSNLTRPPILERKW